jgi:surfeit locus 1 family protein
MIRFRPLLAPTLWFVPGLVILVGLGVWQIERLHWKEALIASVEQGMAAPPVVLADALVNGPAAAEWHHVRVTGRFLHDKEQYVFSQGPRDSIGVQVITPFVQGDGRIVLVDRGFVPQDRRDPKTRADGQVSGMVTVTGVLKLSQSPGMFTPAPELAERLWFVKDVPAIAKAAGVAVPRYLIEADSSPNPGGWPLGGQTVVDFPNNHLQYAFTWFGLALALTGVYLVYHARQNRLGFA